jgi:hypothetical protein
MNCDCGEKARGIFLEGCMGRAGRGLRYEFAPAVNLQVAEVDVKCRWNGMLSAAFSSRIAGGRLISQQAIEDGNLLQRDLSQGVHLAKGGNGPWSRRRVLMPHAGRSDGTTNHTNHTNEPNARLRFAADTKANDQSPLLENREMEKKAHDIPKLSLIFA